MRGIELPINVLVIIMLAVIVLIAVLALYFGGFVQPASSMSLESVRQQACTELIQKGLCGDTITSGGKEYSAGAAKIPIKNFDADKNGKFLSSSFYSVECPGCYAGDTLAALCINYFGCPGKRLGFGQADHEWIDLMVADQECCAKKVCNCLV